MSHVDHAGTAQRRISYFRLPGRGRTYCGRASEEPVRLTSVSLQEAQGPNPDADYSALTSRELLTKDLEELKITLAARKEAAAEAAAAARAEARTRGGGGRAAAAAERQATAAAAPAAPGGEGPVDIPAAQVTTLEGHTNEVFICAWSPTAPLLASGCVSDLLGVLLSICT